MPKRVYPEGAGYANPGDLFHKGFIMVPDWINRRPELSPTDKLVWGLLARRAGVNKSAKGKIVHRTVLAEDLGLSEDAVKRSISRLKEFGLIEVTRFNKNCGNEYHFLDHVWNS